MMHSENDGSITLISHASVIIDLGGVSILTDPWQDGTAFNDSWKLITPAADLGSRLDAIDYLWISHEHPDHFHISTLKALPESFRKRVTVLFQQSADCEKMVSAFKGMLGFANVRLLPHRHWESLENGTEVYCYQSRQIDSALAVRNGSKTILNLNDCEASEQDLLNLKADLGPVDILLNQFSIAGFDGKEDKLGPQASEILDTMVRDHRALGAATTIPFASLVYFCCPDNAKINAYANSPRTVSDRFAREGLGLAVLRPGDTLGIGADHDNGAALTHYDSVYGALDTLPLTEPPVIALPRLTEAFEKLRGKLVVLHGRIGLRLLKPVVIAIPDLGIDVEMSFRDGRFQTSDRAADIEINSQPLHFMLANNFGLQTLGVSGRYRLLGDLGNWFRHRALLAMLNAGIGLSARSVFSRRQIAFFWNRRADIFDQIRYRVSRTFGQKTRSS